MKIAIIGLGYVGLPLGLRFAQSGVAVLGLDVDPKKVDALNAGESYIKHLEAKFIQKVRDSKLLEASTDFSRVAEVDAVLICVPTPLNKHREPDISYALKTGTAIAPHIQIGCLIYNLACPASPVHYQYNPIKTIKTSVMEAINCLGLAKRTGARVFQASTSECYGDPDIHPQPESYWGHVNPVGIRSCYDEGKRCAETLFIDYHRQNNVDIRIARIFNTYGPRMLADD